MFGGQSKMLRVLADIKRNRALKAIDARLAASLRPDPSYRENRLRNLPPAKRDRFLAVVERFAR